MRMMSRAGIIWVTILSALLVGLIIQVARTPAPTIDATNSAAILGLVTAGAVAIERITEGFWTVLGSWRGTWWPLKPIGDRLDAFVADLNEPLADFYEAAEEKIEESRGALQNLPSWIGDVREHRTQLLADLRSHTKDLQQLEPGNPRARAISAGAMRAVVGLKNSYPNDAAFKDLQNKAKRANDVLAGVDRFVQTFEDNPARRLMSLYAGAILGLFTAGILGLDAIQAVYESEHPIAWTKRIGNMLPWGLKLHERLALDGLGVAATGLVMGLGSVPAHEAIKALQESKKRNQRNAHSQNSRSR